jgi:cellulose synthase/poly-beta-1,6-N-acetylglucosamine synthase-like glycosyltransferase
MKESIMLFAGMLFCVLFLFLIFVFCVFIASRIVRRKEHCFEPKITVVVPAYNEEKNIMQCISSIYASNYDKKKMEVIVVDDGSNDNTLKILKKFKSLKTLRQNHLGKVEAMNKGLKASKRAFIVTIDADTILEKDCIKELIRPFYDNKVGAATGNNVVSNKKKWIGTFQNVEYHHQNLIRNSFSVTFNSGIWFSGSIAAYRKSALEDIKYFKKDTMAEDQDVALEIRKHNYKIINSPKSIGHTVVPDNVKALFKQRSRWWIGTLQAIVKNKSLFNRKSSPSVLFLYIAQFWWSFYAFLSLPLIIYQINYWLPYNMASAGSFASYIFKWFSLYGPIWVLWKIPESGVSVYSIFGVLAAVITTAINLIAIRMFRDRITLRNLLAVFFYFPYTIVLNMIILVSLVRNKFWKRSFYIK